MSVLATHRLGKRYQSRKVVDDVSLSVRTGEVAGLLGPNGAGKTTCFYMIVGLIPCAEGTISLDDIDLTLQPMHVRARHGLGYLPQEASIFRKMTVAENILSVLEIRKGLDRQRRHEHRGRTVVNRLEVELDRPNGRPVVVAFMPFAFTGG